MRFSSTSVALNPLLDCTSRDLTISLPAKAHTKASEQAGCQCIAFAEIDKTRWGGVLDVDGWSKAKGYTDWRKIFENHADELDVLFVAITLVDRHVTVILNGKTIIDNQPVEGCTGGALWSAPFRPGPLYLQGNHSDVDFRNMVLRPVVM